MEILGLRQMWLLVRKNKRREIPPSVWNDDEVQEQIQKIRSRAQQAAPLQRFWRGGYLVLVDWEWLDGKAHRHECLCYLLIAKRDDRIDFRGAACGDVAGGQR